METFGGVHETRLTVTVLISVPQAFVTLMVKVFNPSDKFKLPLMIPAFKVALTG